MADKQLFAPMPLRAMRADLSGLNLRILIAVAAHDRMSLASGKGQGCRASNDRLSTLIGCSYARLCSGLSDLAAAGFIHRSKLGRHTVYQVIYTEEDRLLFGNSTPRSKGCRSGSDAAPIGCHDFPADGSFLPETPQQYIPLNGRKTFGETGEYNSSEEARRADALLSEDDVSTGERPPIIWRGTTAAALAKVDRELKAGSLIDPLGWWHWFAEHGCTGDPQEAGWVMRVTEQLVEAMPSDDYAEWSNVYGYVAEQAPA